MMDILKHGADVEVLKPDSLRQKIQSLITQMSALYP
jgi:predicted DNA-binding transcriptional regulator YafY